MWELGELGWGAGRDCDGEVRGGRFPPVGSGLLASAVLLSFKQTISV